MDNSQSSDCFPEDDDSSYMSPAPMDTVTYETLLGSTKQALSSDFRKEMQKDTFSTYFSSLLEECSTCINQSLDLITELLSNSCINKLTEYLTDAACLLQLLSDCIKTIIESLSMTCCSMKMFPITTGHIIFTVFSHCKDRLVTILPLYTHHYTTASSLDQLCQHLKSTLLGLSLSECVTPGGGKHTIHPKWDVSAYLILRLYKNKNPETIYLSIRFDGDQMFVYLAQKSESLYGNALSSVEKQLKYLFRNCHELQLTYLMVLQKHFIFDVTENEDKHILIETVTINLKIGELVQSLDIKTMAEQWKGLVVFSEKYANVLTNTDIFEESNKVYCKSMKDNMKIALEQNQDDKVYMRALKTASFALQILWKTFQAFRQATGKDYSNVIDLMFYIQRIRFLETAQFTDLLVASEDLLIKELLADGTFRDSLLNYNVNRLEKEDDILGFLLTITTLMKKVTQSNGARNISKCKLIACVYEILQRGLLFSTEKQVKLVQGNGSHGLFEHLLIHSAALAITCSSEEFCVLERNMVESILSTDCCKALFSANLWVVLARNVPTRLFFNQFIWLCTMFKTLDKNKMFQRSPQKVHLRYTITKLFRVMELEDQLKIRKQFSILDDDNLSLWTALCVNNFPEERRSADENVVADKLKQELKCFDGKSSEGVDRLIKILNLAATCTFPRGTNNGRDIEELVLHAWSKTCPKHFAVESLDPSTLWYYDYLQALVSLTESVWHRISEKNSHLVKLLHFISGLIQQCNTEVNLLLINTLCKLGTSDIREKLVDVKFASAFSLLSQNSEIERNKLNAVLIEYRHDRNLDRIINNTNDAKLIEIWSNIKSGRYQDDFDPKQLCTNQNYSHKCIEREVSQRSVALKTESSGNFEFDIDNLFMNDSVEEPSSKKVKLNSDAEAIIERLENDATSLCNVKENVFTAEYKNRIQSVCDKLRNIVN